MHEIRRARLENLSCQVEAARQCRRCRAFDLDDHLDRSASLEQEIDFGAILSAVVIRRAPIGSNGYEVFNHKPLPACSRYRMPKHLLPGFQIEQGMSEAAIANVELRSAYKPFARIAAPRTKPTDQQQVDEQVDIPCNSRR